MRTPEILSLLKELHLVEMEAAFGDYLSRSIRSCENENNNNGVKSFHDGPV
jgi:hypothetical protein